MSNLGLSVSDVVQVSVSLAPIGAPLRNFGSLLVLGDSDVIDTQEQMRLYTSLAGVGADFGAAAPEYLAATEFFGQSPTPALAYVGRWASGATHGRLRGGVLSAAQQAIGNFTGITSGGMQATVDGNVKSLTGLNFSGQTNLNGIASVVQTGFAGAATVTWDANNANFWIKSASTGAASTLSFATPPAGGSDISGLMAFTSALAQYVVGGIPAETIESRVTAFCGYSNNWYELGVATTAVIAAADLVNVAGIIEAQGVSRIFAVTTQDGNATSASSSTDLAALLKAAGYMRTMCQYSSATPYAAFSMLGKIATVNWAAANTALTLKFQQEPGVTAEFLTETQASTLAAKNCNVFVNYNNATAILQQGVMVNGYWIDEVVGADWLQNAIQTDVYNLLLTAGTKIPFTDSGVNRIVATVAHDLAQAVTNGFVAPGVWEGPPVGALATGQALPNGYYIFAPTVASLSQTQRNQRQAPVLQAAIKLAGAIHSASVLVSVNQ